MAVYASTHVRAFSEPVPMAGFWNGDDLPTAAVDTKIIRPDKVVKYQTHVDHSMLLGQSTAPTSGVTGVFTSDGFVNFSGTASSLTSGVLGSYTGQRITTSAIDSLRQTISVSTGASTGNIFFNNNDITVDVQGGVSGYTITYSAAYGSIVTGQITVADKKANLRQIMKNNLIIKVGRTMRDIKTLDPKEIKARETLRDMISEKDWRRYLTNGFIMVKGQNDFIPMDARTEGARSLKGPFWYQIFGDKRVQVFYNNQNIGELCIHSDQVCPASDHTINMKVLVELDEMAIWKDANFYQGCRVPRRTQGRGTDIGLNGVTGLVLDSYGTFTVDTDYALAV